MTADAPGDDGTCGADADDDGADTPPTTTCQCGEATCAPCDARAEVTVEWMPPCWRDSHTEAGYAGRWPGNGALRLPMARACADALLADDPEWTTEIGPIDEEEVDE